VWVGAHAVLNEVGSSTFHEVLVRTEKKNQKNEKVVQGTGESAALLRLEQEG